MGLHQKKDFAELCGLATNELSVYVRRGKVIVDKKGYIDDSNEVNKVFLIKRRSKLKSQFTTADPVKKNSKKNQEALPETTEAIEPNDKQSYSESERQLKYLDTLKRRKEVEKLDLDIAKKKGEVIPSELIKPVFLQHNQSIVTEFKNAADEIIRMISKKKDLSVNEIAEIRGELTGCINDSINKATVISVKAVENIINEFAEKKGVGERNA